MGFAFKDTDLENNTIKIVRTLNDRNGKTGTCDGRGDGQRRLIMNKKDPNRKTAVQAKRKTPRMADQSHSWSKMKWWR